jgi:hypothetical protein
MPYFKDEKDKIYFIPPGCAPVSDQEVAVAKQAAGNASKAESDMERERVMFQIAEIERQITLRRLREAILTEGGRTWLADWEVELQELREELKDL